MNKVSKRCHKCSHSFQVLEDEQFDHRCPHCGPEEIEDKSCGDDACGDEIFKGDYILDHDGEIILESNALDYLVDILGAIRKVAGEED
jgi:predicted RNA-binding Zn-ribbon protein involved in translation (DUF1610 family)